MREAFARAAPTYDDAAFLAQEVGRRMDERLDYVRIEPNRLADIGCATGDGVRQLSARYPKALAVGLDYARPMLAATAARSCFIERLRGRAPRLLQADARALPLQAGSLDLAWSNLVLHWLDDPRPVFAEIQRALAVGGLFTFSLLGPDTLKELRAAARSLGLATPQRSFLDMHDVGDMLVGSGLADPVMDTETLTITYASLRGLLRDQRRLGVRDALFGRTDWRSWRRLLAHWQRADGRYPASFEIVYGHAWKPAPRVSADGRAVIQVHRPVR